MTIPNEWPAKCHECAGSAGPIVSNRKCHLCRELEFEESVLCDLNRHIQVPTKFTCHAFRPILKLVGPAENKAPQVSEDIKGRSRREAFRQLLHSDKIKYKRALALQRLQRDPEGVYLELKYHLAWNVMHRRPVFSPADNLLDFDFLYDMFFDCSELVGGLVNLLWAAPDHVHLYLETDGNYSVERMVQEIKRFSNTAILNKFSHIQKLCEGNELWDVAYFCKTIG